MGGYTIRHLDQKIQKYIIDNNFDQNNNGKINREKHEKESQRDNYRNKDPCANIYDNRPYRRVYTRNADSISLARQNFRTAFFLLRRRGHMPYSR